MYSLDKKEANCKFQAAAFGWGLHQQSLPISLVNSYCVGGSKKVSYKVHFLQSFLPLILRARK